MPPDETPQTLEALAQGAALRRYAYAQAVLWAEEDPDSVDLEAEFPDEQLEAPYCGCETCVVREILMAAWPYLLALARLEVTSSTPSPSSPSDSP